MMGSAMQTHRVKEKPIPVAVVRKIRKSEMIQQWQMAQNYSNYQNNGNQNYGNQDYNNGNQDRHQGMR